MLPLHPPGVRPERPDPADERVEPPPRREDKAVVGGHDLITAERGHVEPVVEAPAADDERPERARSEGTRDDTVREWPAVTGQLPRVGRGRWLTEESAAGSRPAADGSRPVGAADADADGTGWLEGTAETVVGEGVGAATPGEAVAGRTAPAGTAVPG